MLLVIPQSHSYGTGYVYVDLSTRDYMYCNLVGFYLEYKVQLICHAMHKKIFL